MNISKVKDDIIKYKGKLLHFKYNGARNQIEEFDGKIENTYNAIFTIKLEDNCNIKENKFIFEIIQYLNKNFNDFSPFYVSQVINTESLEIFV